VLLELASTLLAPKPSCVLSLQRPHSIAYVRPAPMRLLSEHPYPFHEFPFGGTRAKRKGRNGRLRWWSVRLGVEDQQRLPPEDGTEVRAGSSTKPGGGTLDRHRRRDPMLLAGDLRS